MRGAAFWGPLFAVAIIVGCGLGFVTAAVHSDRQPSAAPAVAVATVPPTVIARTPAVVTEQPPTGASHRPWGARIPSTWTATPDEMAPTSSCTIARRRAVAEPTSNRQPEWWNRQMWSA